MRCYRCTNKFTEELGIVKKNKTHTIRSRNKIVSKVLSGDIKNTAKRNDLSEGEVETMLKDTYEELRQEKPTGLRKLGIDVRSCSQGPEKLLCCFGRFGYKKGNRNDRGQEKR